MKHRRTLETPPGREIGKWLLPALSVLLIAPILWVQYPPMADLPQHAAQISVLLDWNEAEPPRSETYRIDLLTPYLLAYGLAWLLAQVMPLAWALKLLVSAALLAFPWAVGRLVRRVGGPDESYWLAFPLALSYSFHWGFLNYLLATPLIVLFVELCVVHGERPTRKTTAWVALGSVGLFFCHAILGGLAGLIGGGLVALRMGLRSGLPRLIAALGPFAAPIPFLLPWLTGLRSDMPTYGHDFVWNLGVHRLGDLLTQVAGWSSSPLHLGIGLAVLVLPFVLGARPSHEAWRWWPFACCCALGLFWPELFLTTSRVAGRFAVFLLPFLLLACRRATEPRRRHATLICGALAAMLLLAQAANTYSWQQQTRTFHTVLEQMPAGKSVLALIFLGGNHVSPAPVNSSMVHWYLVEKDGIRVDPALIDRFPFVVRYREEELPDLPHGFSWRVHEFDWHRHGGARYDLFVILAPRDVSSRLFPPGTTEFVGRAGSWYLYRRTRDPMPQDDTVG
ncbi:MAG: hypothetical protein MPN21_14180 [Thermoanaerobaculia bacterium]|nr:hypothetical protein [Thermoanaerobaculia bacterium]